MQTSPNYPQPQPTNQIPFNTVRQPHGALTPTLQSTFPAAGVQSHSLTPQLQAKHYPHSATLSNPMSGLALSTHPPNLNPVLQAPVLTNQIPPSFQPLINPASSQPIGFNPSQQLGLIPPQNPQTLGFNSPSQPPAFMPPTFQQQVSANPLPSRQSGIVPSQSMTTNPQPSSQSVSFNPAPSSQPIGLNPLLNTQPNTFTPHTTSQPFIPHTQSTANLPPNTQTVGFYAPTPHVAQTTTFTPPTNPHQQLAFNIPPSQSIPTNTPSMPQQIPLNAPIQPGFNRISASQPVSGNLTTQPMGFNQYPPQLVTAGQQTVGAPPLGQFVAPPITSQPKVTPDSIPSVVEIFTNERERWVSNEYLTGSRTPPPGSLIPCPIRDTGNCSPRFIRSSLYTLPTSVELIQESKLIPGIIVQPLASDPDNPELPLVDHGPSGPIRCKRCKAYMNPFNSFSGGGASYECAFCGIANQVPSSYFQYCDASGKRVDAGDRHELSLGSYEMLVTKEYMRHQKDGSPPAIVLIVDISQRSYNNGIEGFLASHIAGLLERLPRDETSGECPMEVGLIAYDTQAYFFNLSTPTPLIYVLTDSNDPFLPEPSGTLVPVQQGIAGIRNVLDRFQVLFPQRKTGGCLGVAAKSGLAMLRDMGRVGKLLIFQSDIPEVFGPGQVKRRTDNFFKSQSPFYDKLSLECQKSGVSVDMFLFPSSYTDVFTLGQLCQQTGGHIHYHYNFTASKPASYSRLLTELQQSLSTEKGFDAVMRIRTSTGLSPDQFQGAIRLNGTEVQMSGLDACKSVAVVLKYDDKLKENSLAYIQVALLYTNFRGQRRLRLHNLALSTSSHFEDVYLSADLDALVHLLCRLNLRAFIDEPLAGVAERIRQQVAHILAGYRRHCNPGSNRGQLILPSTMKLLPCYSNCILKLAVSPLHNSVPNAPDIRAFQFYRLQWLPTRDFILQLYPRVFPVDPACSSLPEPIRSSLERVQEQRAYLATDGQQLVLWVGSSMAMQLVAELFGVSSVHQVDPSLSTLPKLDNDTSRSLHQSIQSLQSWVGHPLSLVLSKQGDTSENIFRSLLVEDGISGRANYVDATCLLHREIKKLIS